MSARWRALGGRAVVYEQGMSRDDGGRLAASLDRLVFCGKADPNVR